MTEKIVAWTPPKNVSTKEIIGRRAFGSRIFNTDPNSTIHYKIDVFLDNRIGTGLSVDRLGVRRAVPNVLAFLCPLCDEMANKGSTEFKGWAQISVSDVHHSIMATDAVGEQNPYHAEIDRSDYQNERTLRSFAFELCVFASKHEFLYRSDIESL